MSQCNIMRLTIAYFKIKKRNLVSINNNTYQRETLSERPIRQPLNVGEKYQNINVFFYVCTLILLMRLKTNNDNGV